MNKRLIGVLAFAFAISAGASVVLYRLISSRVLANAQASTGQIVVATRNLEVGTLIRDQDVKLANWNGPTPPQSSQTAEAVLGRGVVSTIYSGEPVLENRLAAKGAGAGLAATIPIGMRAVAVRVDDVAGVAGFVTPGMRVDVLVMGSSPTAAQAGTISKTLLQNVEVLSAGQSIQKDVEGKPISVPVVNLLCTPEKAEILGLASSNARIQLVLRNPMDKEEAQTSGTAMNRLFDTNYQPPPPPKPAPAPRAYRPAPVVQAAAPVVVAPPAPPPVARPLVVEVIHGARRAEAKFTDQEKKDIQP